MVKYLSILKAMESYVVKCPTIAEKKRILANMSFEEKNERLDGVLNQGEKEWYKYLIRKREYYEREKQETLDYYGSHSSQYRKIINETLPQLYDDIFKLERKILEKEKNPKEPPFVDEYLYREEVQSQNFNGTEIGEIEQEQISLQEKENIFLDMDEFLYVSDYFSGGHRDINSKLNDGHIWNSYSDTERKHLEKNVNKSIRALTKYINRSTGLVDNTVVYHSGKFDVTKMVGDKVKFKGFTSASFQKAVADGFKFTYHSFPKELDYTYKMLLPKGTKGLCGNADSGQFFNVSSHMSEHEFLLDKGLEAQIISIDYDNKVVTVLVQ